MHVDSQLLLLNSCEIVIFLGRNLPGSGVPVLTTASFAIAPEMVRENVQPYQGAPES